MHSTTAGLPCPPRFGSASDAPFARSRRRLASNPIKCQATKSAKYWIRYEHEPKAVYTIYLTPPLNRHLKGWKNYFDFGYPRQAFREINAYVCHRLTQHLRRRSQRPFRPPEGVSYYEQIRRFGLVRL